MDAFWIAFYEYPEKFLGVNYKASDSEKLKLWSILAKSCCWFWCYENYCFISDRPTAYHWDENYRLHNTTAPAITWIDGWELYYVHGRSIPKDVFDKCLSGNIAKEEFIKETNEEIRAAIYEILGQEKIMELLGAKEINKHTFAHQNGDLEEVILFKTNEKFVELDNQPLAWVRFICPSTGTNYLIDVEPHHTSAKDAAISTSPLFHSEEEYSFTKRS
jgi:hypothetical protein